MKKTAKTGSNKNGVTRQAAAPAAKPTIDLRTWMVASPHKLDQLAGFGAYAAASGFERMTVAEWEKAYLNFLNAPLGGN